MITLKSIGCEAFRSFTDVNQTPELANRGFFGVRGFNKNTGGSSGAGKSSFTHLIAYLLGYSPYPATKQQSFLTKKPMQVWGTLESPEGLVEIRRGRETSIKVGNEDVITGSVARVNERLEKLFGVGPELLRNLTYRPQRKPGLFLSLADAEKKKFLSKVLGLEELQEYVKESAKTVNAAFNAMQVCAGAVNTWKDGEPPHPVPAPPPKDTVLIGDDRYSREDIVATIKRITDELVIERQVLAIVTEEERDFRAKENARTNGAKEALRVTVLEKQAELQAAKAAVPTPALMEADEEYLKLVGARDYAQGRIAAFQTDINKISLNINSVRQEMASKQTALNRRPVTEANLVRNQETIDAIQRQECPTCHQQWLQASLEPYLKVKVALGAEIASYALLEADLQGLGLEIETLEAAQMKLGVEDTEFHNALRNIEASIHEKNKYFAGLQAEYKLKLSRLDGQHHVEVNALLDGARINQANSYSSIQAQLDGFQAQLARVTTGINQRERMLQSCEQAVRNIALEAAAAQAEYEAQVKVHRAYEDRLDKLMADEKRAEAGFRLEDEFATMVKGFLGAIFSEVLDEIAGEANQLLAGLPNVATTTIAFDTEKTKGDGGLAATIIPRVTRSGQELDMEANLSGGQLAAVEIAVDLAVSRIVQRRTGSAPGWLVLDEAFTGFDAPVVESCLYLLSKAGADLQIFIIDHSTEVRDRFTNVISVVSENDVSRIEP